MAEPFRFADGQLAHNIEDLIRLCKQSPKDAINYLMRADFENWLTYIGKNDLAKYAKKLRQSSLSDSERLNQFLTNCQQMMTGKSKKIERIPNLLTNILQSFKRI